MKKHTLTLLTWLCLLVSTAVAQPTVLFEDFETAQPPSGWNRYQFGPSDFTAWAPWWYNSSQKNCMRFEIMGGLNSTPCNSWLVSPAIKISNNSYQFSADFWNSSTHAGQACNIMISTGSGVPTATNGSFTLINTVTMTQGYWQNMAVDLSAYNGQTVYIGIQIMSTVTSAAYPIGTVDNFKVAPTTPYANASLTSVVAPAGFGAAASSQNVIVKVKNKGTQALSSYSIAWTVDGVAKPNVTVVPSIAAGATADVTLGNVSFADGNHTITAAITTASDIDLTDNNTTGYYSVGASYNNDAAVAGVWPNGSGVNVGVQPVVVNIKNNGTSAMSNIKIDWSIDGGVATSYTETVISIPVGEEKNIQVGTYNFASATSTYLIKASLVNGFDPDQSNNTMTVRYGGSNFMEDFNSLTVYPSQNWSIAAGFVHDNTSSITHMATDYAEVGSGTIWTPKLNIASGDVIKVWATTPCNGNGTTSFTVYSRTPGGVQTTIQTVTLLTAGPNNCSFWNEYSINIGAAAGINQIGISGGYILFDNISSTASYAYPIVPGKSAAASITNTGAALSWLASPAATGYTVQYRDINSTTWTTVAAATNSYTMSGLISGTKYEVQVRANNANGSSEFSTSIIFTTTGPTPGLTLNLTAMIEGLCNGSTMISDVVSVEIHNATSPYAVVTSKTGVSLSTAGAATINFTGGASGVSYYIAVKHRNSIETWSMPVTFVSGSLAYDFTTAATKAFGSNMKLKGTKWCFYSGDVNGDCAVDLNDLTPIDNDAFNYVGGANLATDVNGDQTVDLNDMTIVDNNAFNYVGCMKP